MEFLYSVAIRTLGTAGEKYEKLLKSIQKQTIQPEKIIVVLPEKYNLPQYQLGYEEFVFSKKGMVSQRLEALKSIDTDYVLFCDDDVELECTFVEKLANVLLKGRYVCASGPLLEFFPPNDLKHLLASVLGGACVMVHGRNHTYTRILKTGGWSYNHSIDTGIHKVYEAESLAWTCFMIMTDVMKDIHYEDEMWTERNGYAAFDDQTMFYKLLVNDYKTCVVSDAHYLHNDGKTSTESLKLEPYYAGAFNHYVFWHRYIYSLERSLVKRCWTRICISYYIAMSKFYSKIKYHHSDEVYKTICKAFADAKIFVKSKEYYTLRAPVINY